MVAPSHPPPLTIPASGQTAGAAPPSRCLTQPLPHPSGQCPQRGQGRTLSHAGQAIHQPAELDQQRAQPGHQHRRAHPQPAPPVPHGGVRHPKSRGHRAHAHPRHHPLQCHTNYLDHVQAPQQQKRRQQRVGHPTRPALGPRHPHPPHTAEAHIPPIARPEHHRLATVRAVRPWDPHPTARSLVLLDAQRARPYDGHGGRHRLGPSRSPNSYGRVLCWFRTPASCPPPRVHPKSALPFPRPTSTASHAGNTACRLGCGRWWSSRSPIWPMPGHCAAGGGCCTEPGGSSGPRAR